MPESRYSSSDAQKRLAQLRRQVYGGSAKISRPADSLAHRSTGTPISPDISDISFLRQDLTKIALLSSLALGAQLLLYFLFKNHLWRLNLL